MVVVFLGIVFLGILGLLLFSAGRHGEPPRAPAETLTVLAPRIRIRTEANANAPVVTTATAGEKLLLLDDRGAWVRVQDADGLAGWAERGTLERTAERERRLARFASIRKLPPIAGVSNKRTPLYAGPGIFYPIVGELSDQTQVKVFTRDHDFYAIDQADEIAYADIDAIDVSTAGSPQLEVRTPTTPPPEAERGLPEAAAPAAAEEEAEQAENEPPPTPAPVPEPADRGGVYSAVPAGGTQPEEIDRVMPRYPPAARAAAVAGSVVIRGIVRRNGRIDDVEIIKDLPYGLGDAARDAVRRWRFRPATLGGEPIDVYYTVTVNFRLH